MVAGKFAVLVSCRISKWIHFTSALCYALCSCFLSPPLAFGSAFKHSHLEMRPNAQDLLLQGLDSGLFLFVERRK